MGATNSNNQSTQYFELKAKVDKTNVPYFSKYEGKGKPDTQFDTLSGYLKGAEIKEKDFEGVKSNIFVLHLEDEDGAIQLRMTHNNIAYSIINVLSGLESVSLPKFTFHVRRREKDGGFFGNAFVKADNTDLKWAFPMTDAPQKKAVILADGKPFIQNGKQVYDHTEIKAFWENVFNQKVIPLFTGSSQKERVKQENEQPDTEDESMPF